MSVVIEYLDILVYSDDVGNGMVLPSIFQTLL